MHTMWTTPLQPMDGRFYLVMTGSVNWTEPMRRLTLNQWRERWKFPRSLPTHPIRPGCHRLWHFCLLHFDLSNVNRLVLQVVFVIFSCYLSSVCEAASLMNPLSFIWETNLLFQFVASSGGEVRPASPLPFALLISVSQRHICLEYLTPVDYSLLSPVNSIMLDSSSFLKLAWILHRHLPLMTAREMGLIFNSWSSWRLRCLTLMSIPAILLSRACCNKSITLTLSEAGNRQ